MSLIGAIKILDDRKLASRERNKMHARKTRQRKKEHMNQLENRVQELKQRQLNLKLRIEEKNTANILLGMFANIGCDKQSPSSVDPKIDELLKRQPDDIPDSSKIPDLPALILPGNHNKRRKLDSGANAPSNAKQEYPNDGIDYELLGKDRTSCTPEELDRIRKERNRMHAKRTRDRKRIFMEEMEKIIKQLETENNLLEQHLSEITSESLPSTTSSGRVTPSIVSPAMQPSTPDAKPPAQMLGNGNCTAPKEVEQSPQQIEDLPQQSVNNAFNENNVQLTAVVSSAISTVSVSPTPHQGSHDKISTPTTSISQDLDSSPRFPHQLPSSITTTSSQTAVGC